MRTLGNIDLYFDSNNGVIAVYPCPLGRLRPLWTEYWSTYQHGDKEVDWTQPMVWVFKDNDGEDAELKGLVVGNRKDWEEFKADCKRLGLSLVRHGCYVPLSNGPRDTGKKDDQGVTIWSWSQDSKTVRDPLTFVGAEKLAKIAEAIGVV